jgi:hypothetical protein
MNVWRKAKEKNVISSNCFILFVLSLIFFHWNLLCLNFKLISILCNINSQISKFQLFHIFLKEVIKFFASPEKFGKTDLRRS